MAIRTIQGDSFEEFLQAYERELIAGRFYMTVTATDDDVENDIHHVRDYNNYYSLMDNTTTSGIWSMTLDDQYRLKEDVDIPALGVGEWIPEDSYMTPAAFLMLMAHMYANGFTLDHNSLVFGTGVNNPTTTTIIRASGALLINQERTTRILPTDEITQVTIEDVNQNWIYQIFDETITEHIFSLPLLQIDERGVETHARFEIFNHHEIPITIRGTRSCSVDNVEQVTINSKYISVVSEGLINDKESVYTNYQITSAN